MTHIFNEKTTIIGVDVSEGRLSVKADLTDKLTVEDFLFEILIEIRKVNLHLAHITDLEVTDKEVDQ